MVASNSSSSLSAFHLLEALGDIRINVMSNGPIRPSTNRLTAYLGSSFALGLILRTKAHGLRVTANPPSPASTSQVPKKPRRNNQIPFSFCEVESFKELQFYSRTRGKLELVVPRHNQWPCDCPPCTYVFMRHSSRSPLPASSVRVFVSSIVTTKRVVGITISDLFGSTRENTSRGVSRGRSFAKGVCLKEERERGLSRLLHLLLPRRFHVDGQFTQEVAHSSPSEVAILETDGDNPHGFYFAYNRKVSFTSSLEGCSKFQHLLYGVIEGNLSLSSPRDLELGDEVQGLACDAKRFAYAYDELFSPTRPEKEVTKDEVETAVAAKVAAETEQDKARKESKKLWRDLRRLKKRKIKELEEFLVVMEKRLEADAESSRVKD
ncbi:unnamed protein product [Cochlearia groenlandica]